MPAADVLEGTWEDIVRHADRLAGKRVRLVVVDSGEAASPMAAASGERERAWNEWCAAPRPKTPPLSEEAISRESIYSREQGLMACLVDTNLLLWAAQASHPLHVQARAAVRELLGQGEDLVLARQNLLEFWVVATRAPGANGLGMTANLADTELQQLERSFESSPTAMRSMMSGEGSLAPMA